MLFLIDREMEVNYKKKHRLIRDMTRMVRL